MTYDEITLFRRFLKDKGTQNNFEYFYFNHRFDKRNLDEYFKDVDGEDVIMNAFDMSNAQNTIFNFKYWEKLSEQWNRKLVEFRHTGDLGVAESLAYCKHCNRFLPRSSFALGVHGLHKHCKECEGGEWDRKRKEQIEENKQMDEQEKAARQLEKEITEKTEKLNKTTKVCSHCGQRKLRSEFYPSDTSDDGLQSWCKSCQDSFAQVSTSVDAKQAAKVREEESSNSRKSSALNSGKKEDFTFFDFDCGRLSSRSIGKGQFAINNKRGNYKVTMNVEDSKTIIDNDLTFVRLRQDNVTGALHIIFNRTTGAKCTRNKLNVTISNKEMVKFLIKILGYEDSEERVLVDISENISRSNEYATYLIKRNKL